MVNIPLFPRALAPVAVAILVVAAAAAYRSPDRGDLATGPEDSDPVEEAAAPPDAVMEAPLFFEPNLGQAPEEVQYLAQGPGVAVQLLPGTARLTLRRPGDSPISIDLRWLGGNADAPMDAGVPLPGRVNYLHGREESRWLRDVPTFEQVRYTGVYPGIDAVFYGNPDRLEYDFVVSQGASPAAIRLEFGGAERVELEETTGDLLLHLGSHYVRQHHPIAHQEMDGVRVPVDARYVVDVDGTVSFELGDWDRTETLVIDPVVDWASYVGSATGDWVQSVAVTSRGVVVVGATTGSWAGTLEETELGVGGGSDVFVAQFGPTGRHLFTTYVGGENGDGAADVALDASGNIYVTGTTSSGTFPTTANAALRESASLQIAARIGLPFLTMGEAPWDTGITGDADAFITKLSPDGSALLYSSYLSGSPELALKLQSKIPLPTGKKLQFQFNPGTDTGKAIAVSPDGIAYVVGVTLSDSYPVTPDAFKSSLNGFFGAADGFISKIDTNRNGSDSLVFSSYIGGSCHDEVTDVALDDFGLVYITGHSDASFLCGGFTTSPGAAH